MLLNISKPSRFCGKRDCRYLNQDFDDILSLILNRMNYDHIELTLWPHEMGFLSTIEFEHLVGGNRFSAIKLDKNNSIKLMEQKIYENLRFFEINLYCGNKKFFRITSDNYGEHTSITIEKSVKENEISALLVDVFS